MKGSTVFSVFLIMFFLIGFQQITAAEDAPKVLLFITDGSPDLEFMLTNEAGVMKKILEESGFQVDIATQSGEPIAVGSVKWDIVLKLANVNADDYSGIILPCMAVNQRDVPKMVEIVKKAADAGKIVAAQFGGVEYLAKAGVLKGRKYSLGREPNLSMAPDFKSAIYNGTGIVRDGNIITSGVCPFFARGQGLKDGTPELTKALIEAIKGKQ